MASADVSMSQYSMALSTKVMPWLALVLIPSVSVFSTPLAVLLAIIIIVVSAFRDSTLVYVSLIFCGYHGILQLNNLNFFGSIIDVVLTAVMLARVLFLLSRGFQFPAKPVLIFLPLFICVLLSALVNASNKSFFYLGLVAKDFIAPLCAYYYFVLVCYHRESLGVKLTEGVRFFILGIAVVGLFSLLNYFFVISESFSRFVLTSSGLEKHAAERELGGLALIRMNSLFILSTQGAASCLYGVALCLTLASKKLVFMSRRLKFLVIIILFASGVASVSMTFWLTILIFMGLFYLSSVLRRGSLSVARFIGFFLFFCGGCFIVMFLPLRADGQELVLIAYGYSSFIEPALMKFESFSITDLLLGIGPFPKLYLSELQGSLLHDYLFKLVYDNWLFGIVFQLGFISTVVFFIIIYVVFTRIACSKIHFLSFLAGVAFLSLVGFSHGTFIIDRLFIFKATFLLAVCLLPREQVPKVCRSE